MGNIYNIYNEYFFDENLFKEIEFARLHLAYQMNVEDVSLINLGIVKPNLSEEEQIQFDFYHPMSLIGSGWSTLTKMFHMEAKT